MQGFTPQKRIDWLSRVKKNTNATQLTYRPNKTADVKQYGCS